MSDAFDDFILDRDEEEFNDGSTTCKRCGTKGLIWEEDGDRWKLVTIGGRTHRCPREVGDAHEDFKDFPPHD